MLRFFAAAKTKGNNMATDLEILKQLEKETGGRLHKLSLTTIMETSVDIEGNGYAIDKNGRIIGLKLSRLKLEFFPSSILQLNHLLELNLLGNRISYLPSEIGNLINLEYLDLYGNRIASLPPEIVKLKKLRRLEIEFNQLSQLPYDICELESLEDLRLYQNELTEFPPKIGELKNLRYLDLRKNQISQLPKEVVDLEIKISWAWAGDGIILENNPLKSPPIEIVKKLTDASIILTTEIYRKKNPTALHTAEQMNLPVYSIQSNSLSEVKRFISQFGNARNKDSAMNLSNVERLVEQVFYTQLPVNLPPADIKIRKIEHQIAARYGLNSESFGEEPRRFVVVYPPNHKEES